METVNITINNIPLEVLKGATILQAAKMINIGNTYFMSYRN